MQRLIRTLEACALEGLREFSKIATAPQKRAGNQDLRAEAFKGRNPRSDPARIQARWASVFPARNEVETIENIHEMLAELVPEARIVVGHGQLPERELERA